MRFVIIQYNPSDSDGAKKNARFARGRPAGSRRSTRRRKSSESEEEESAPSSEEDFSDEPKRKAPVKPTRAQRMLIFIASLLFNEFHYFHTNLQLVEVVRHADENPRKANLRRNQKLRVTRVL